MNLDDEAAVRDGDRGFLLEDEGDQEGRDGLRSKSYQEWLRCKVSG